MRRCTLATLVILSLAPAVAVAAPAAIRLDVDARDAGKKLIRATETIPVTAGPVTLAYPKWIPGEHGPTGPINELGGLEITAGGKPLPWRRDGLEMFQFHVDVPKGTTSITVKLELMTPTTDAEGLDSTAIATAQLLVLNWHEVLLYPAGTRSDDLSVTASLRLPAGWTHGTALAGKKSGATVAFSPVTLTTLVDSPVLAGAHTKTFALNKSPPVRLFAAADSDRALEMPDALLAQFRALVAEELALFGARHFAAYTFLVALSDATGYEGIEHHESSDNRIGEDGFVDDDARRYFAELLPHEMTHSWNGKYRRPAGLATATYDQPVQTELLWVYEGLTQYLGWVLSARSGLRSGEDSRDRLAMSAAELDGAGGRTWRALADTTAAAQLLYGAPQAWRARRRGVDFYDEGVLLWLEIDTIIRRETKGKQSLDDFCKAFHGGKDSGPAVVPYTFDDLVAALNKIAPYDWAKHLTARLTATTAHAPLGGITGGGWKLAFTTARSAFQEVNETIGDETDVWHSIGLVLDADGTIVDVRPDSPADTAGVAPGSTLIAADGRAFKPRRLRTAIAGTVTAKQLDLLVRTGDAYRTVTLAYAGGERYPHLVRDDKAADVLADILAPRRK